MEGIRYKDEYVFLYSTLLHTKSPILKGIYCESHRLEPWAVEGRSEKYGRCLFPNSLYIKAAPRDRLLQSIAPSLEENPSRTVELIERFTRVFWDFQLYYYKMKKGEETEENLNGLITATVKLLSSGIFKEAFEYPQALELLGRYMPTKGIKNLVLTLYQPLCLPHFMKYEQKLHYFTWRYSLSKEPGIIQTCIDKCAWLTRFLVEETPYDDFDTMKETMEDIIDKCGGDPEKVRESWLNLRQRHAQSLRKSSQAKRDILQIMDDFAAYSSRSRRIVISILDFISFLATLEELKHIVSVQTARIIRNMLKDRNLPVETTNLSGLLSQLK